MDQSVAISVLVLAKDAGKTLPQTLASVGFAREVVVLDNGSKDDTAHIAQKMGAKVVPFDGDDFSRLRNRLMSEASYEWILYVDADETVSSDLQKAMAAIVAANELGIFSIRRINYFFGRQMYDDWVERLFHTSLVKEWRGQVHEHLVYHHDQIKVQIIHEPIIHTTHTDITSMLDKTNGWSEAEVELRHQAHHPPVAWWRLARIGVTFFGRNYLGMKLWRFGREGLFEAYFQMVDKLIVYTKLWERQHSRPR